MKIQVIGWARQLVSITTSDAERRVHAVVKKDGWQHVAMCGAPCPNGFADMKPSHDSRSPYPVCRECEGLYLDALGVRSILIEDLRILIGRHAASPESVRACMRKTLAAMSPLSRAEGLAMIQRAGIVV